MRSYRCGIVCILKNKPENRHHARPADKSCHSRASAAPSFSSRAETGLVPIGAVVQYPTSHTLLPRTGSNAAVRHDIGHGMCSVGSRELRQPRTEADGARHGEQPESSRARASSRRSVRTSAGSRSRQWPSRSEHSVPSPGAGPDQRHLFGHPWRPASAIAVQSHEFIGRGPGSTQRARPAREALGRGRRSTGSRARPDRR